MISPHVPVMLDACMACLDPKPGGVFADVTLGRGGHAQALLERTAPNGRLLAVDRDPSAVAFCQERLATFADRVTIVHGTMSSLRAHAEAHGFEHFDGVFADLGVSSPQLDEAERGFSFQQDGPLDMRMDSSRGQTARELIDSLSESELADVIFEFGEERRSRRIARSIKRAAEEGELETTTELRRAVVRAIGPKRGRVDPATRTFQGIRIAVNRELDELRDLLENAANVLRPGGVLTILSFHSLEDRIVKQSFRGQSRWAPLFKKPRIANADELAQNPRSRSAKLRAAAFNGDEDLRGASH